MPLAPDPALSALQRDWTFRPSTALLRTRVFRIRDRLLRRAPGPARRVLKRPAGAGSWTLYFAFLPDGTPAAAHRDTVARLRALDRRLLIVCAAPDPSSVPDEFGAAADALVWKALGGYDFSGYAAGLLALAEFAPGADAFVLNDSVFGPFGDVGDWLARARWALTGFTATSNLENHIQSYAFVLRDVTPARLGALRSVFMPDRAFQGFRQVVVNQESRLARVANRTMSVGSLLYADTAVAEDPTLQLSLPLLRAGFPFLKRSLLGGKLAHLYPQEEVAATLRGVGYPV